MNTEDEFKIRIESYEFYLDECIKYEHQVKSISISLERSLEELNIGLAKKKSRRGLELCEKLETLYTRFDKECDSFRAFLEANEIEDGLGEDSYCLVSGQVKESQKNIIEALEKHKQLFFEVIEN